jgi:hypothetical protein
LSQIGTQIVPNNVIHSDIPNELNSLNLWQWNKQHLQVNHEKVQKLRQEIKELNQSALPKNTKPSKNEELSSEVETKAILERDSEPSSDDELPKVSELVKYSQRQQRLITLAPTTSTSSRPVRDRKPTAKQASQIRNAKKKNAKLAKKPKTVNTTQLEEFNLPFRSSQ